MIIQKIEWEQKTTLGKHLPPLLLLLPHNSSSQSVHLLSHPLPGLRSIFLTLTYLLEISITVLQRYLSHRSHPNPLLLFLIKLLAPPRNHCILSLLSQSHEQWCLSLLLKPNSLLFDSIPFRTSDFVPKLWRKLPCL